jgi:hypothetical protein
MRVIALCCSFICLFFIRFAPVRILTFAWFRGFILFFIVLVPVMFSFTRVQLFS